MPRMASGTALRIVDLRPPANLRPRTNLPAADRIGVQVGQHGRNGDQSAYGHSSGMIFDLQIRRIPMPTQDELKGKLNQVKGKIKQGVGDATDDPQLHDEGVADELAGDVQEVLGLRSARLAVPSRILATRSRSSTSVAQCLPQVRCGDGGSVFPASHRSVHAERLPRFPLSRPSTIGLWKGRTSPTSIQLRHVPEIQCLAPRERRRIATSALPAQRPVRVQGRPRRRELPVLTV